MKSELVQVTIRLAPDELKALNLIAAEETRTLSQQVREMLKQGIKARHPLTQQNPSD